MYVYCVITEFCREALFVKIDALLSVIKIHNFLDISLLICTVANTIICLNTSAASARSIQLRLVWGRVKIGMSSSILTLLAQFGFGTSKFIFYI